MKHLAELLRAVTGLLWPGLAIWIFLTYKEELRRFLGRVKKGKVGGVEFELEKLEQAAKKAQSMVAPAELRFQGSLAVEKIQSQDEISGILQEAARSPKAALLLLASKCEKELRDLLLSTGWHGGREIQTIEQGLDILDRLQVLPRDVAGSVRLFADARNRLIHGYDATDDNVLRALDSGISVLKALRAIPYTVHVVYNPCAELFLDAGGKNRLQDVCGLILEERNPSSGDRMIFPTTRKDYQRGERLSWEWNAGKVFGETWYKDPDSGEIKPAWLGSAEFTGRNLDADKNRLSNDLTE